MLYSPSSYGSVRLMILRDLRESVNSCLSSGKTSDPLRYHLISASETGGTSRLIRKDNVISLVDTPISTGEETCVTIGEAINKINKRERDKNKGYT